MKFRLRTLFLITTVVAIVAFTFTLGREEGFFTLIFFASIFGSKSKRDRWMSGVIFVVLLVGMGTFLRQRLQTQIRLNDSPTAGVSIFFSGREQTRQTEVYELLSSEMPYKRIGAYFMSRSDAIPFYRSGYIRLRFFEEENLPENLPEIEAEVRRLLAEKFPDLTLSIKSHSVLDSRDEP